MQATHDSLADNPSSSTSRSRQHEDMKGAQFVVQSNLKIMAKSIAALSKISEDMHIEISEGGLFFKVSHRFKYCVFRFAPEFFNACDLSMINKKAANICRLSMKTAQRIFKTVSTGEKHFTGCEFRIDPKSEKMIVNLTMNYDIKRMFHVKLREMTTFQKPVYDRALCRNTTVVFASTLIPILAQMKNDIEVTMKVDEDGITIKNFSSVDGITTFNATNSKAEKRVKTETRVGVDKLSRHKVTMPVEFAFSVREFLSIATFADQLGSEVCLYYDLPGKPMILSIEAHPNFDIELALVTMGNDDDEVDLDGGIVNPTTISDDVESQQSTKSAPKTPKTSTKTTPEIEIEDSSTSSRSKRGPLNTSRHSRNQFIEDCGIVNPITISNDVETAPKTPKPSTRTTPDIEIENSSNSPSSSRSKTRHSRNQFIEQHTTLPIAEESWRDHEVPMEATTAVEPEPVAREKTPEITEIEPEPIPELMEVDEPFVENAPMDFEEVVEPAKKKQKVVDKRNRQLRCRLLGTSSGKKIRMTEQLKGIPLAPDTQI